MLVVDDNKVIRQLIRVNLELEGLEVVTAADGAECLDVVHQVQPDVVTLDVVMPRLDGLRTAARLRADPRTRHLPLAIISACTQYEVETGLDVGVDAFLAKPFEPAELVRLVKHLIERRTGPEGHAGAALGAAARGGDLGGGDRGEGDHGRGERSGGDPDRSGGDLGGSGSGNGGGSRGGEIDGDGESAGPSAPHDDGVPGGMPFSG